MRFIKIVPIFFLLSACCSGRVCIRQEVITKDSLASVQMHTPDPRHEENPLGQRLIVKWRFPKNAIKDRKDVQGLLKIRYYNFEQQNIYFPITGSWGFYVYDLLNEEYFEKEGILTYKVEVICEEEVIEEWTHQLWAELISFD